MTPPSAIAWAATQDLPDEVDAAREWAEYVVRYKQNKPPWESYPSPYLYEGWGVNVAMLCAGEPFDTRQWINERHGLEFESTTDGAVESLIDAGNEERRGTMQSREEGRD